MKELYLQDLTEEERAELRTKRREARKEMERERKKAIRAAYKRLRDSKKKPDDVSRLGDIIYYFVFFSYLARFRCTVKPLKTGHLYRRIIEI